VGETPPLGRRLDVARHDDVGRRRVRPRGPGDRAHDLAVGIRRGDETSMATVIAVSDHVRMPGAEATTRAAREPQMVVRDPI